MNTMINDSRGDHICGEKCSCQEYCNKKTLSPQVSELRLSRSELGIDVRFTGVPERYEKLAIEYWIVYKPKKIPAVPCDGTVKKLEAVSGEIHTVLTEKLEYCGRYGVRVFVRGVNGFQTSPEAAGYTEGTLEDEVTEPNDTPMELPAQIPQKPLNEIWNIIKRTPFRNSKISYTTFGNLPAETEKYQAGILAPNGKIYALPCNASNVLEIDPMTKTLHQFGELEGISKYYSGVLAPNGKIYGIPGCASKVLEINPISRTLRQFGDVSGGNDKYNSGVLAPNGKIYCLPISALSILEIDPETDQIRYYGDFESGVYKYSGATLAPNGKIYGFPSGAKTAIEFDPESKNIKYLGNFSGEFNCAASVLASNGKIYGLPYKMDSIIEIDPEKGTASQFGEFDTALRKFYSGTLAADGRLYSAPFDDLSILQINPFINLYKRFGEFSGMAKYAGTVLAPNGKLYGIPCRSTTVLEIDTGWRYKDPSVCLSPFLNKR